MLMKFCKLYSNKYCESFIQYDLQYYISIEKRCEKGNPFVWKAHFFIIIIFFFWSKLDHCLVYIPPTIILGSVKFNYHVSIIVILWL